MCGRTVCSFGPKCVRKLCSRSELKLGGESSKSDGSDRTGEGCSVVNDENLPQYCCASDNDPYKPCFNMTPGRYCPVLISRQHDHVSSLKVLEGDGAACLDAGLVEDVGYVIQPMFWGLIPSWHKGGPTDFGLKLNNTRVESLSKPMFKRLVEKGMRCVVVVDGYYEWKSEDGKKQPYFFYCKDNADIFGEIERESINRGISKDTKLEDDKRDIKEKTCVDNAANNEVKDEFKNEIKDEVKSKVFTEEVKEEIQGKQDLNVKQKFFGEASDSKGLNNAPNGSSRKVLTMAGLFDAWVCKQTNQTTYSFSIITVESQGSSTSSIHHRMPAILKGDEIEKWLDFKSYPFEKVWPLLRATDHLTFHAVSSEVNNSRTNSILCLQRIPLQKLNEGVAKRSNEGSVSMMESWVSGVKKRKTQDKETDTDKETGKQT